MPEGLYSTAEAAAELHLAVVTIKKYVRQRRLRPIKVGHDLVFTQAELDRFQAIPRRRGRPPTTPPEAA